MVVVIDSSPTAVGRGGSNHAFNTKMTRKLGLMFDVAKEFKEEMRCRRPYGSASSSLAFV